MINDFKKNILPFEPKFIFCWRNFSHKWPNILKGTATLPALPPVAHHLPSFPPSLTHHTYFWWSMD